MPSHTPYDWAADEQSGMGSARTPVHVTSAWTNRGAVAPRTTTDVNPVTGHALDCACSRCPGWYLARAQAAQAAETSQWSRPVVPTERKPNALTDQVVPVSILMAVFTMCMVTLLPVVTPLLAVTTISIVALVTAIVVLAIVALTFLNVARNLRKGVAPTGRKRRTTLLGAVLGRR